MILLLTAMLQAAAPVPSAAQIVPPLKLSKKPEMLSGGTPWPAEARALGYHGTVLLSGMIKPDGSIVDLKLEQSSKSPQLDEAAMKAVANWKFSPARDAAGNAVEIRAKIPVEYDGDDKGAGWLARYRCDVFTRDMNWWRSVNPGLTDNDHKLYNIILGARVLTDPAGFRAVPKLAERQRSEWAKAVTNCASKPNALLVDQFSISRELKALANIRE